VNRSRGGAPRRVTARDGREFFVSPPSPAGKPYTCPGCGQVIERGHVQVTVWEADSLLGAESALELRRHWHAACAPS
jgi:hypothetical protein